VARAWSRGRRLINIYGPSETTLAVTLFQVGEDHGRRTVPLGPPVPNTRLYVLDSFLNVVPVGVTGELYIGGAGLARGYVGSPGLTASSFVADPFGPPGTRLYRTGDLVRWNADGRLEFAGRADHQVKIRGYRVEPGEVESALLRLDRVAEAVVTAQQEPSGHKRLVAYVVPKDPKYAPGSVALRAALAGVLPAYMMPSAFVTLPALPLNPTGKVDRAALPAPTRQDTVGADYRPPRNATEEVLVRLWSEVLGAERIGVEDDFFELGGDSVTSLRLMARVGRAFGVDVSPRDFFDAPTIAALAANLHEKILAEMELQQSGGNAGRDRA